MGSQVTCCRCRRGFCMTLFQTLIVLNLVFMRRVNSLQEQEKVVVEQEKATSKLYSVDSLQRKEAGDESVDHFTPVYTESTSPEILLQNNPHSFNYARLNASNNYLNMSSSSSEPYSMMPMYGYVLSGLFLFVIWIVGTSGNFLVIYLVARNKQLQTPMNLFLVNLSIADFTMAGLGAPASLIAAALGVWPFGSTGCIVYAFGMSLAGITSITTLMVLAFERFLMIARPFRAADIQNQHSLTFIGAIWIYSLILTLPPLFGWASYGPEAAYISCSVSWETNNLATSSYIVFLFAMGLVLPLITILCSYLGILLTIRATGQSQTINGSAAQRAELRVVGMVATMVTSFLFAWSPYAIFSFLVAFSPSFDRTQLSPFLGVLPCIFAKSSSCYNPIIYVGLNTQFRAAWMKLLGLRRSRDEEGNTALTLSATVGIPKKEAHGRLGSSNNTLNHTTDDAESTFIAKQGQDGIEGQKGSFSPCRETRVTLRSSPTTPPHEFMERVELTLSTTTPLLSQCKEEEGDEHFRNDEPDTSRPEFTGEETHQESQDQRDHQDSQENCNRSPTTPPTMSYSTSADRLLLEESNNTTDETRYQSPRKVLK